jgi:hypothetical protein
MRGWPRIATSVQHRCRYCLAALKVNGDSEASDHGTLSKLVESGQGPLSARLGSMNTRNLHCPFGTGGSYLAASLNANEAAINFLTFSAVSPFR